ncbi:MAG: tetratricopeptide repeat protein [Planctomycetes bacterium]|nr:tetratricopeptide repeat protein [Planctomycetota bacterium]
MKWETISLLVLCTTLLAAPVRAESQEQKIVGQRRFNISYNVDENLAGLSSVEIWVTTDGGKTYSLWGRDEDRTPPVLFEAPSDGVYGFVIVSTDKVGNRENPPQPGAIPEAVAVVDTTPPAVRLDSPAGGQVYGPGTNVDVRWAASDANLGSKCVDLMLSSDDGNTWTVAQQAIGNSGSAVLPLPGAATERYLVKVVVRDLAGNVGQALTKIPLVVDGRAPQVKLTGPKVSAASKFNITYEAEDIGGAGLGSVVLWYTRDGGLTWNRYGVDKDLQSPMEFSVEQGGSYGFFMQATDRVGNSTVPPRQGTRPEIVTVIDDRGPTVELLTMTSGAYKGGETQEIRWNATDDNMGDRPINIEYTVDGGASWFPIAKDEPNDGSYNWTLPRANSNRVMVRVSAVDALGNRASATSRVPLVIDSIAPQSRATFDVGMVSSVPDLPAVVETGTGGTTGRSAASPGTGTDTPAPGPQETTADKELDEVARLLNSNREEDLSRALGQLDGILLKDPQNGRAYALRGRYYSKKKNYSVALEDLNRALALRPQDGSVYQDIGKVRYYRGRDMLATDPKRAAEEIREAVSNLERAIAVPPESSDELLWAGIAYVQLAGLESGGRELYGTAINRLTEAIRSSQSTYSLGVARFWRAQAKEKSGDLNGAAEDYERAAESLGDNKFGDTAKNRAKALKDALGTGH